jgi:UDP-N-acetylenolpyruvoylglucosamine reductase
VAGLIRLVRQRVFEARGVLLELEIEVWGMEPEELLPSCCPLAA